ncbi:MAG: Mitomycin resistance protein mcrB [Alphaproteobacteria bacterium 16-39-46]|nr:MAG: Mitomycin resistance protein mcrB [Alphaproteobacteria bacterium 16-39-46]OZA43758.1 MAG: Mitomycin resistance protein mcrB [Alphaproteobacteria bacterium 17-39-52]HQS83574.1 helix-hairpin-helix domain-containing protein [Alphaproteobacteria bacterium]HQS93327.1 helix-hairpin-helix domain-containing protein [Alphaproteobacteria bacterium]
MPQKKLKNELLSLMNVGPAVLNDLKILGIDRIAQLRDETPDHLYEKLQTITQKKHEPCMWDVFAAIIHEAETGEKRPWWDWSKIRKNKKELPKN